ncbi:TonB-dependent receptor [Achromobacter sp. GG226]|uniref:TonB-dependent receptor n=1 Tax=Verticiella alkaliphila TaxID=2779529 RepID=UPI001C0E6B9C|nr:TonB-dependent receptor [Verticiella sp. GG226]MBU4612048.1 TonB-dependent receptor [Verticiella sp. GG226]
MGEVRIYGDRSTTSLQDSNSSVAVVGPDALDAPTVHAWRDAFRQTVNVETGDFVESGFVIRGINAEGLTPGGIGAPLASFYVDGVQQTVEGTRRGARGTFDAEQIEIYRGPQSTLAGRNALAGAIYLRTADPTFSRSGRAQVTLGQDQRRQMGLAYGDAISETLAFRVSGEWSQKESDLAYPSYRRFDRYGDFTKDEYHTLRGKLLWLPTGAQDTRVLLSYARSFDRPGQHSIVGSGWSSNAPGYDARRGDAWGDILPDMYRFGLGLNELPAFQEVRSTTVDNVGLELTHVVSNALTLTSQTGWTRSLTERHSINEGMPGEFLAVAGEFDQKLFTQELRANYEAGRWRAVAGLYGAQERQGAFRNQQLLSVDRSRNQARVTNLAAFGEASYAFAPAWRVLAGGRVDHVRQRQSAFYSVNGAVTSDNQSSVNATVFLPKLGLERSFAGGTQRAALVYQEGYRPGGAGIQASTGRQFEYDDERAKNLELSWRGQFLDERLNLAASVFYQRWNRQQVELRAERLDAASSYVTNAGRSVSRGAEFEASYAATRRLDVYAGLGLLHTRFKDFRTGQDDFSGLAFAGAPQTTLALGFRWGHAVGWYASGNARYTSSRLSRLETGVPRPVKLDDYTIVDATLGYGWRQGVRVTAYVNNLFDKNYFRYESGPGANATLGERREVGLRLDYEF